MTNEFELHPATTADEPWLVELRRQTMDPHFEAAGQRLSEQDHIDRVLQQFECIRIITVDRQRLGMIKLDDTSNPWRLVQFQIRADWQGRNVGRRVLEAELQRAADADAKVSLSVLKVNPARRLYERLGFCTVSESAHSWRMLWSG